MTALAFATPVPGWKSILGLPLEGGLMRNPLAILHEVESGIPAATVDRLADRLSPDDKGFKFRIIPKATYERRKREKRLSPVESERVVRLARVYDAALSVWRGDEAAQSFLARAHPLLEGRKPLDVALGSGLGADAVIEILQQLEHGSAL